MSFGDGMLYGLLLGAVIMSVGSYLSLINYGLSDDWITALLGGPFCWFMYIRYVLVSKYKRYYKRKHYKALVKSKDTGLIYCCESRDVNYILEHCRFKMVNFDELGESVNWWDDEYVIKSSNDIRGNTRYCPKEVYEKYSYITVDSAEILSKAFESSGC